MERLRIIFDHTDSQHKEWEKGERGLIDGYVRGGDGVPYAVILKESGSLVMAPFSSFMVKPRLIEFDFE